MDHMAFDPPRDPVPIRWQDVLARQGAGLPFASFYDEVADSTEPEGPRPDDAVTTPVAMTPAGAEAVESSEVFDAVTAERAPAVSPAAMDPGVYEARTLEMPVFAEAAPAIEALPPVATLPELALPVVQTPVVLVGTFRPDAVVDVARAWASVFDVVSVAPPPANVPTRPLGMRAPAATPPPAPPLEAVRPREATPPPAPPPIAASLPTALLPRANVPASAPSHVETHTAARSHEHSPAVAKPGWDADAQVDDVIQEWFDSPLPPDPEAFVPFADEASDPADSLDGL